MLNEVCSSLVSDASTKYRIVKLLHLFVTLDQSFVTSFDLITFDLPRKPESKKLSLLALLS